MQHKIEHDKAKGNSHNFISKRTLENTFICVVKKGQRIYKNVGNQKEKALHEKE